MTVDELSTLDRGCVGMVDMLLGLSDRDPLTFAFGDPVTHWVTAEAEKILAAGDIANSAVRNSTGEI